MANRANFICPYYLTRLIQPANAQITVKLL